MADTLFFGRKYELTVGESTWVSELGKPAMDIKFELSHAIGTLYKEGTISILGLRKERMNSILELAALDPGTARQRLLSVKLTAGYHSAAGTVDLFRGFVVYATITSPPNMWLNMKVSEINPRSGTAINCNVSGEPTVTELVETLIQRANAAGDAAPYGYEFVDHTVGQKCSSRRIANFMVGQAPLVDALGKLSEATGKFATFLFRGLTIEAYDVCPEDRPPDDIITIDGDHGLLSVSGISVTNARVTTFIQNRPTSLTWFNLDSKLNPQANGKYQILREEFKGHFAGREWYMIYEGSAKKTLSGG